MLQTAYAQNSSAYADLANMTFEPIELVDKLAFLACYSQRVIALESDQHERQASDLYHACMDVCPVVLMDGSECASQIAELYAEIAEAFGLSVDFYPDVALSEFVGAQSVRPLVIFTGCERMNDAQLANAYGLVDRTGLGLTLFSKTSLGTRKPSEAVNALHTSVRKLSNRDVKQLLRRRARQEVHLSDRDIQQVVDRSRGNLDKADAIVADLVGTQRSKLGLPLAHMSMLVLFVAVVIGAFVMGPTEDTESIAAPLPIAAETVNRVSTRREDAFTSLTEPVAEVAQVAQINRPSVTASPEPVELAAVEDEQTTRSQTLGAVKSAEVKTVADNALVSTDSIEARLGRSEPILLGSPDPNAWINNLPATSTGTRSAAPGLSQRDWVGSAANSAYTLQIIGSYDESRIMAFMQRHSHLEHFGYFETTHQNQPWFVLTYGRYNSRDDAVNAIPELIRPLRDQKPWARGVASLR